MKRTKTSKNWMHEHVDDFYVQEAQKQGYRSRAAFKLIQANEKFKFIKHDSRAVDLGAAPGSWSEVLSRLIGKSGRIVALDILEMQNIKNVEFIQGDFREQLVLQKIEKVLENDKLDLVISDMAPNISGIKERDDSLMIDLVDRVLFVIESFLKAKGSVVIKVFHGESLDYTNNALKERFKNVKIFKPKASRPNSKEIYVIGKELKII